VAAVDTCRRYDLRRKFVSRRVLIASVLLAVAGFAAAVALPTRALAGGTGTSPTGATGTTTTSTTTTTPKKKPPIPGVSTFPAAGGLLLDSVPVRVTPNPRAHVLRVMHQFRSDFRPQEMFAVRKATGSDGNVWYRVSIPMRPNGTYGWIPASSVSLSPTHSQIVVNLNSRTIDIYRFGKHKWRGKVAIGAPGRETPVGHYFVAARFVPYQDPFLGVFAEETSAYSKLTEWPGGGVVGIHGTSLPQLLGQAVSHGCVRVSNLTATKLRAYAPLGTPIWIKKSRRGAGRPAGLPPRGSQRDRRGAGCGSPRSGSGSRW
jgi:lipoprotein-anchoring transpeptidase ErfK/SrfK